MTEICDPYAGWYGLNHKWAQCRGHEDACITCELLQVTSTYAYVGVDRTWAAKEGQMISPGEYVEYTEGTTVWRIHCDGVNTSQNLASIRICYEGEAAEGMKVGDTETFDGTSFTLTKIICTPVQEITALVEGHSKTIGLTAMVTFPTVGVLIGGLYVALKSINSACDRAIIEAAGGGLPSSVVDDIDTLLEADYTLPDGTKPTPEEIHKAKMDVIDGFDYTDPEFVVMVESLLAGTISKAEFEAWLKQYTIDRTKIELDTVYYTADFSLDTPMFVMAGEVQVSGTAPQPNQEIQICATKKFFGFDFLAADEVLATVTSDAEYKYEATLNLDEFGIIEVYARIPQDWWNVLEKDLTTAKHTLFVMTWTIILFLIIAAALVYDKSTGKLGLLKKRR